METHDRAGHEEIIHDLLGRGVAEYIDPTGSFRKKLEAKLRGEYPKDIVVKFGVDVTRPDIHLGHAVVLRKLRALQDAGCKVIFLIGDFTTLIGDPTGKSKTRPEIDQQSVEANMRTYLEQVDKVLDVSRSTDGHIIDSPKFSWMRNSDWFFGVSDLSAEGASKQMLRIRDDAGKEIDVPQTSFVAKAALYENTRMQKTLLRAPNTYGVSFVNLLAIMRHISYAQLIERDMFQERIKKGEPLFVHEMLYPIIQGADSNVMANIYGSCDLEIGGTDQVFNMLMGRKVMEVAEKEPQAVMGMRLLVGLDGSEKMSKSLDNYIGLTDTPEEMYGKVMSLPDTSMREYYELATYTPLPAIDQLFHDIEQGKIHPKDAKMALARQIVEIYHGKIAAESAERGFIEVFQRGDVPDTVPEIRASKGEPLSDAIVRSGVVPSKSEYRRLLEQGAISRSGKARMSDPHEKVEETAVYRIGKHLFVRVVAE